MTFVPFPNGHMVEVVGVLVDRLCENTFWFLDRLDIGPPPSEPTIAANVLGWYEGQVMPLLSERYTTIEAISTPQDTEGLTPSIAPSLGVAGSILGECHPANVTYRINLTTALSRGHRRGCIFVPGIARAVTEGNQGLESWRSDIFDAYVNLIDLATTWNLQWVVASKFEGGSPRAEVAPFRVDFLDAFHPTLSQRRSRVRAVNTYP